MDYGEYLKKIQESLTSLGSERLENLKVDMINALVDCEIDEIEESFKGGLRDGFYLFQCHEMAMNYMLGLKKQGVDIKDIVLAQAMTWRFYKNEKDKFEEEHSWVEIKGEIVFDGVLQRFYRQKCYHLKKVKYGLTLYSFDKFERLLNKYGYCYFGNKS